MFGAGSEQKLGHDGETGFIIYIEYGKYNPKKAFPTCNRRLFILLCGHLRRKSEEETRGTEEEGW
jgi:hypothetical protein